MIRTQDIERATVAELISALLEHPETPEVIAGVLIDEVLELASQTGVRFWSPEVLEVALPLMMKTLERSGAATNTIAIAARRRERVKT